MEEYNSKTDQIKLAKIAKKIRENNIKGKITLSSENNQMSIDSELYPDIKYHIKVKNSIVDVNVFMYTGGAYKPIIDLTNLNEYYPKAIEEYRKIIQCF